jgi:GH15 family glucan-1,4-alpha-glucosidase
MRKPSHRRQHLRRTDTQQRGGARPAQSGPAGAAPATAKIGEHAAIGNLRTMALVSIAGIIDFMCWPDFDSPSVFAALLDPEAGLFAVTPEIEDARVVQSYMPDSNVLVTRWLGEASSAEIFDLMTVDDSASNLRGFLLRQVRCTRGTVRVSVTCRPRFDYARGKTTARHGRHEIVFHGHRRKLRLALRGLTPRGDLAFKISGGAALASLTLKAGEALNLTLSDPGFERLDADRLQDVLERTNAYWQHWAEQSTYQGRWRDRVTRSALALKMMTSRRHGSIVAAATFGLPESRGGRRNWDYRATWIRDASFTVYSLTRLGYRAEGMAFARWASERAQQERSGALDVMYTVDGGAVPEERNLDFAGYAESRPVRIGNEAAKQLQLDIYGALLDAIYLNNKYGEAISHADWQGVRRVIGYVCKNWRKPDAGIWERRGVPQEHLHSRLMCWVALDRAIRLSVKRSLAAPIAEWLHARSEISADIWENFWNARAGHFGRTKGSAALDGAMLMMPLVRFVGATDPQWLATLDAIGDRLGDDVLIMRYRDDDGLDGHEGAFGACAFWYVECLARAGRITQARSHFEKLLAYANHVGLYSEEFSPKAEFLGNFPQALTHLAMISAAFYLDRKIAHPHGQQWPA